MVVRMKCFYHLLKTELFYSCILPLPYIVILEIGIEFSITDLISTKLILYRYSYFWFIVSKLPFLNVLLDNNSNQSIISSVFHNNPPLVFLLREGGYFCLYQLSHIHCMYYIFFYTKRGVRPFKDS